MAVQLSGQPSGDGVGAVVNKVFRTTLRLAGSVAEGSYRVLSERFMGGWWGSEKRVLRVILKTLIPVSRAL